MPSSSADAPACTVGTISLKAKELEKQIEQTQNQKSDLQQKVEQQVEVAKNLKQQIQQKEVSLCEQFEFCSGP